MTKTLHELHAFTCGSVVVVALLTASLSGVSAQELPPATEAHGGFALQDRTGTRLLLKATLAKPELLTTALCSGGKRVPVEFSGRQAAREGGTFRETAANFDYLAGSVFNVRQGAAGIDSEAVCLLASDALLAGATISGAPAAGPVSGPAQCLQPARFAKIRNRAVSKCWSIARFAPSKYVALVEFERRGTDAAAAVVLVDGAQTIFADFSAVYQKPGESLWRVDDDGVLSPDGFKVVTVLQRGSWYALAFAWAGAEGRALSLWISDGSDRFVKTLTDYWYQAPFQPRSDPDLFRPKRP